MITQTERPFKFSDIIGQKGIISEMKKRSKTMDFPEVLIFSGDSGTGKSTLARIVAALINDPKPIINRDKSKDPNPESPASKSVLLEKFNRDIKHYDASSMGKDDVIKLGQTVNNAPMFDKNKVIIIDEAQALSKAGKGVTLDLLEKKRKGVYFILCTMDINSFDKAVRSRGQIYKFRSPKTDQIAELLFKYTEKFNVPVNETTKEFYTKGIYMLAENCEGSVRMAMQNFERCIYGEFFTVNEIEREFGIISNQKLSNLIIKLINCDKDVLKEIKLFNSKDFFYKAFKTLNEAFVYQSTGYISAAWKKNLANHLDKKKTEELIDLLMHIDNRVYFNEDILFVYLAKFIKNNMKTSNRIPVK